MVGELCQYNPHHNSRKRADQDFRHAAGIIECQKTRHLVVVRAHSSASSEGENYHSRPLISSFSGYNPNYPHNWIGSPKLQTPIQPASPLGDATLQTSAPEPTAKRKRTSIPSSDSSNSLNIDDWFDLNENRILGSAALKSNYDDPQTLEDKLFHGGDVGIRDLAVLGSEHGEIQIIGSTHSQTAFGSQQCGTPDIRAGDSMKRQHSASPPSTVRDAKFLRS